MWSSTTNLPYKLASHTSINKFEKIYVINGSAITGGTHQNILESTIASSHSLSAWTTTSLLPEPLIHHRTVSFESFVYVLGGYIDNIGGVISSVDSVYYSDLSGGSLLSWTTTTSLPTKLSLGNAVVVEDRIYYAGGFRIVSGNITYSDNVYMTEINPSDGTIGVWTETTPIPFPLYGFGMIENGNKIIIIGGTSGTYSDKVYESEINPIDGTLGPWVEKDPLPNHIQSAGVTKIGSTVVVVGGVSFGPTTLDNVYYAEIDGSGSIGAWAESTSSLPQPLCCGSLANTDTHLYYTGGHNVNTGKYFNTVYMASFGDVSGGLSVPNIKQYSPPWNDDEYDHASQWFPSNPTVERWGCALTSASMVLQTNGHNINPDGLNDWLKAQPDGYVRNGLLNWLAVSRYSFTNSSPDSPALEFMTFPADNNVLDSELEAERPPVVRVPGHFAVVKGKESLGYYVNDPASSTNVLLSQVEADHLGPYFRIYSYYPSSTDLSYIMLVLNEGFNIQVFDENGNEILGDYFVENPLIDNIGGEPLNEESLGVYMYPKPESGNYRAEVSGGTSSYQLDSYLYDKNGNVYTSEKNGAITEKETDVYLLSISKDNSDNSSISVISFDEILKDLKTAYKNHKIKRGSVYRIFIRLVTSAKRYHGWGRTYIAKQMLSMSNKYLIMFTPRFINPETSSLLQIKISLLKDSL